MMKRQRKTLLAILLILIVLVETPQAVVCGAISETNEECTFCDGDELTLEEKYEELIVKALTDEQNMLDDGIITEEVYKLQCEPFEKALDDLESATEEETLEDYKSILIYFFDQLAEYEAEGEEIDQEFYEYILQEIEKYEVEL